jgi:lipopolysaccharide/colanic/teichoic acid biosynthesis glycosyltransferase
MNACNHPGGICERESGNPVGIAVGGAEARRLKRNANFVMAKLDVEATGSVKGQGNGLPLWKRALDLALVAACAPGLALAGTAIGVLIKCGSPGPLFFRQRRVGHKGREFTLYKFRTMHVDADTEAHRRHLERLMQSRVPMAKLDEKNDPRMIPFGSVIRACGLDELPQVLNVIRGEMSFIGPRPCIPYECDNYQPWHWRRFEAVPGLTGLWQVSGKNRTTFDEMVRLDIEYSEKLSLGLDLKILFKTLPALWRQYAEVRGAKQSEPKTVTPSARELRKSAPSCQV